MYVQMYGDAQYSIDVKKKRFLRFFIIFIKNAFFNVFIFRNDFLYSSGEYFYHTRPSKNPTKPAKLLHKTTFK